MEAVEYNHANQDREQWTMNLWGPIRGEELNSDRHSEELEMDGQSKHRYSAMPQAG
jgi:hypothetical protein